MTAASALRRFVVVCAALLGTTFTLQVGAADASSITFRDGNLAYATSQVGVTCYGRYVHYRADTFVTAGYGNYRAPEVQFLIEYDVWNGSAGRWEQGGLARGWQPANIGGQFALNLPTGVFFRLHTWYAYRFGGPWAVIDGGIETFNGYALQYCKV